VIALASPPLNEVFARYVLCFYEDYRVSLVSSSGSGDYCTSFGFGYGASMNYSGAVPITDGRLELVF